MRERAIARPRVLVIGGKLKIVRKARELGLDVVYIQHPDEYDRTHWPYVDQALLVDYADTARLLPLVRSLHEAFPFQTVVSLYELGLLPAAKIDHMLGLGGNSWTPWRCCWTSRGCASTSMRWDQPCRRRGRPDRAGSAGVRSRPTDCRSW